MRRQVQGRYGIWVCQRATIGIGRVDFDIETDVEPASGIGALTNGAPVASRQETRVVELLASDIILKNRNLGLIALLVEMMDLIALRKHVRDGFCRWSVDDCR